VGDNADGLPGLPGWGAKSAAAVLAKFGHLESIPADWRTWGVNATRPGALAQTLERERDRAFLFRGLATLREDIPLFESVDDLQVLRMDVRQRLQTKRGLPGQRHVIDWMTLDTAVAWFPAADDHNFGEEFGLYTYDYSWHIGDRTSFLSSGWFETYSHAPKMWSAGIFLERPPRGSFYVGYSELDPIDSRVAQLAYNYWMSPKWISSFSTSHDFGETENLGQSLVLTRIGSDIVLRFGVSWNPLRDNFGIGFELQPRIYPGLHLGSLGGPKVPLEYAPVE
jgi:hypothetical protein